MSFFPSLIGISELTDSFSPKFFSDHSCSSWSPDGSSENRLREHFSEPLPAQAHAIKDEDEDEDEDARELERRIPQPL